MIFQENFHPKDPQFTFFLLLVILILFITASSKHLIKIQKPILDLHYFYT